jgi:hypothetical protein
MPKADEDEDEEVDEEDDEEKEPAEMCEDETDLPMPPYEFRAGTAKLLIELNQLPV